MEANISNITCSFEKVYVQYRQNPLFNSNKIYLKKPGGIRSAIPQKKINNILTPSSPFYWKSK